MNNPSSIRLLGSTNNQRGDLFTRLVKDLFFSLGYDNLELNVPSSGREIDVQGQHRCEPRRVVGECKAHADKMGGSELNKFLGVLTREQQKHSPRPVAGYFISISGFTDTSIQQEKESGDDAIILFDSEKVIAELQRSHVIVSVTEAAELAGQCANYNAINNAELEYAEILGHNAGYIWVIYYMIGKERTHFALIHADGTPLSQSIAKEIIEADKSSGGSLYALTYLAPSTPAIAEKIRALNPRYRGFDNILGLLEGLGEDGAKVIAELNNKPKPQNPDSHLVDNPRL